MNVSPLLVHFNSYQFLIFFHLSKLDSEKLFSTLWLFGSSDKQLTGDCIWGTKQALHCKHQLWRKFAEVVVHKNFCSVQLPIVISPLITCRTEFDHFWSKYVWQLKTCSPIDCNKQKTWIALNRIKLNRISRLIAFYGYLWAKCLLEFWGVSQNISNIFFDCFTASVVIDN